MMTTLFSLAMGAPPAQPGQPAPAGGSIMMIGYMVIIFALFYFLLIRPQMRKEKERRKLIEAIKSGDRVVFAGGLLGTITNVKDQTFSIKIADNVKVEVVKSCVAQVLGKDEEPKDVEKA